LGSSRSNRAQSRSAVKPLVLLTLGEHSFARGRVEAEKKLRGSNFSARILRATRKWSRKR
jgi:hypothetical protein